MAVEALTQNDLHDILQESRNYNPQQNITGCLLYFKGEFLQILEGQKEEIEILFEKIRNDNRHTHVNLISLEPAEGRMYPDWSMAFHNLKLPELHEIKEHLDIEQFLKLHQVVTAPAKSQKLFYYIGKNIIEH